MEWRHRRSLATRARDLSRAFPVFIVLLCATACVERQGAPIADARWSLTRSGWSTSTIAIDIASEADSGLVAPRADQAEDGALHIRFRLPEAEPGTRYRYMVYYRNESYKFPESGIDGVQHPLAHENFYGGFTDGFHLSDPVGENGAVIEDALVIRSDPRNELPGAHWARNPRTGNYSLLIVAVPEAVLQAAPLPEGISDLGTRGEEGFIEPYWYWLHGPGKERPGAATLLVDDAVHLHMSLDLSLGVKGCGGEHGHLTSFIHHIDPSAHFDNVPVLADMSSTAYTPTLFDSMLCFTPKERLVRTLPSVASDPCSSMRFDTAGRCLEIRNPAATTDNFRKENVGIRSRIALTYGRFRVHCQLAPLLNDSDLWNGLTNAIWLFGAGAEGVSRRPCQSGYLSYAGDGGQPERRTTSSYAEIDFEIMKGMPLCPERSFPPIYPQQVADPNKRSSWLRTLPPAVVRERGNVAVACTNWDLACADPTGFRSGCHDVLFEGTTFSAHRWDENYRAVTEKSMRGDDELFGPAGYWFEIDWRPEEIIWRIGPSVNDMRTVGYMNNTMTSVPDVPMWLVISQEFHSTAWWPGSPYDQAGVPFPASDLIGRVFAVVVD